MSENNRCSSLGCQTGPSVKTKPDPTLRSLASLSISVSNAGSSASVIIFVPSLKNLCPDIPQEGMNCTASVRHRRRVKTMHRRSPRHRIGGQFVGEFLDQKLQRRKILWTRPQHFHPPRRQV